MNLLSSIETSVKFRGFFSYILVSSRREIWSSQEAPLEENRWLRRGPHHVHLFQLTLSDVKVSCVLHKTARSCG